jgi:predicted aminopeptidase
VRAADYPLSLVKANDEKETDEKRREQFNRLVDASQHHLNQVKVSKLHAARESVKEGVKVFSENSDPSVER